MYKIINTHFKMSHFNKLSCEYDEDHYDECDACKINTNCDYLMLHNTMWVCSECYYQLCEKEEQETDEAQFNDCEACNNSTNLYELTYYQNQWICQGCVYVYDGLLLEKYTEEEQTQLSKYATCHNISIEEAIEYQTHCHYCGTHVKNAVFDEEEHQYCNERCWESCEDYWYPCHKGEDCRVCQIWEYHKRRDSLTERDFEIARCEPVLVAIDAFQELRVYAQLYECIPDLVEYFDE
jgi:hypothetical protein